MRFLGFLWTFLTNLIALSIIVAILTSGYSNFEKLVLALLVLNYLRICMVELYIGEGYRATTMPENTRFLRLAELLGDPDLESYKTAVLEVEKEFSRLTPKIWINMIFNGLAWLLVIFTIFSSV